MGTDCAPFLANLFLFAYEYKWLLNKFEKKDMIVLTNSFIVFVILMIYYALITIN